MLFGHLLTDAAQIFADVRTYWSPEAVKRVTGHKLTGKAAGGILHLINSGPPPSTARASRRVNGEPAMKPYWEITPDEARSLPPGHLLARQPSRLLPRRRLVDPLLHRGGMPVTMMPRQPGAGAGAGAPDRRRLDGGTAREGA
jgi:L-fucose isomerase